MDVTGYQSHCMALFLRSLKFAADPACHGGNQPIASFVYADAAVLLGHPTDNRRVVLTIGCICFLLRLLQCQKRPESSGSAFKRQVGINLRRLYPTNCRSR